MQNIIINDELKTLLPSLSDEERTGLEASILKDGCLSPLIVWNDTLVDGHYRYDICIKHGIPFPLKNIHFDSIDDAKLWSYRHQENRRNLNPYYRAELALKMKDIIAKKAKKNQRMAGGHGGNRISGEPIDTTSQLADIAGISAGTLRKVEYLLSHADEETKEKLRNGEKGTSIHREYMRLRPTEDQESLRLPFKSDKPNTGKCSAEELSKWLLGIRSAAYVRELILRVLCDYRDRYGKDEADAVYRYLCQSYDQQ